MEPPRQSYHDGMFNLWHEAATAMSSELRISSERLYADHAMLRCALGSPWVERQAREASKPQVRFSDVHPLYRNLGNATTGDIVVVAELALYLRAFKDDPRMASVLSNLRSGTKYRPTLFELAMAYRWKRAGARVILEPEIPHGLADFAAEIDGTSFIAECASFPNDVFDTDQNVLGQFLSSFGSKNFDFPFSVTLELRVTAQTPGDFFGDVLRACREAMRRFRRELNEVSVRAAFGTVTTRRTSTRDVNTGDWDPAMRLVSLERNESGSLYRAHENREVAEKGWICVSMPSRRGNGYEKVREKFIEEYRQLRDVSVPRVILLDITGLTYDVLRADMDRINDGIGQEVLRRPKVSAVWLTTRGITDDARFQYRAFVMDNPNAVTPVPKWFTNAMAEMEYRLDYLTETERAVS
jgi:hypothetical protein